MADLNYKMNWIEELPNNCPPSDAFNPNNNEFFRLVNTNPPTLDDFLSFRHMWPNRHISQSECIVRSISIFSKRDEADRIKQLPFHRDQIIAKITLLQKDGLIKQTFASKYHFSWWRTKEFNLNQCELL
jgi:hypothetical protein